MYARFIARFIVRHLTQVHTFHFNFAIAHPTSSRVATRNAMRVTFMNTPSRAGAPHSPCGCASSRVHRLITCIIACGHHVRLMHASCTPHRHLTCAPNTCTIATRLHASLAPSASAQHVFMMPTFCPPLRASQGLSEGLILTSLLALAFDETLAIIGH
jgi:hypothetical protein